MEEVNTIKLKNNLSENNLDKLRLNLIYRILLVQENDDIIKPFSIIASFKKSNIAYPLDGTSDNYFEMPSQIVNQHNKK